MSESPFATSKLKFIHDNTNWDNHNQHNANDNDNRIKDESPTNSSILIILNTELGPALDLFWAHANNVICCDGGANRLFDLLSLSHSKHKLHTYIPHLIIGDLDSIRDEVKTFYQEKGVHIVEDKDDETTDMQKSLNFIKDNYFDFHSHKWTKASSSSIQNIKKQIICYGAFGGRFDQEIASIKTLYMYSNDFDRFQMISDGNLMELLIPGQHSIILSNKQYNPSSKSDNHCGFFPICHEAKSVTTNGLKWNVTDAAMSFLGLISTNNILINNVVDIKNDVPLIWYTEFNMP